MQGVSPEGPPKCFRVDLSFNCSYFSGDCWTDSAASLLFCSTGVIETVGVAGDEMKKVKGNNRRGKRRREG